MGLARDEHESLETNLAEERTLLKFNLESWRAQNIQNIIKECTVMIVARMMREQNS